MSEESNEKLLTYRENKRLRLGLMAFHRTEVPINNKNLYIPCIPPIFNYLKQSIPSDSEKQDTLTTNKAPRKVALKVVRI